MKLYLMRHPQTTANEQGLIYGKKDYPYTDLGHKQCLIAVEHFKGFTVKRVLASPIGRALTLAKAVGDCYKLEVSTDSRLEEMHQGILEGLKPDVVKEKYPKVYQDFMSGMIDYCPPEGETYPQFEDRVRQALDEILSKDEDILVVSHGGVIRTMIELILKCEPGFSWQLDVGNGSIIEFDMSKKYGRLRSIINISEEI